MKKKIRKNNSSEVFNLSDAHIHDVLTQRIKTGESFVIYKEVDDALYSDNGQRLWRVVGVNRFNVPNGVVVICDRAFYKCSSLKRVGLPESLKVIGNEAFWQCKKLQSIKFPHNLEIIGDYAFNYCWLIKSINIPFLCRRLGIMLFHFAWP